MRPVPTFGSVGEIVALDFAEALPTGVRDWQEAERLGVLLMVALGYTDAALTGPGTDGGIDVNAREACCQVKHWQSSAGRRELQQLVGAAFGRQTVFLAPSFSPQAVQYAPAAEVALFTYDPTARIFATNARASLLASRPQTSREMTQAEASVVRVLNQAERDLGIIGAAVDAFASRVLGGDMAKRKAEKTLATVNASLERAKRAHQALLTAESSGSVPDAQKAVNEMASAVHSAAAALDLRLPEET